MFGEYAALIKWVLILGSLSAVIYFIDYNGYTRAEDKYEKALSSQKDVAEKLLNTKTQEAAVETAKSRAYASFIQDEYNEKVDQVHKLTATTVDLNNSVSRLHQRSLCGGGSPSSLPKDSAIEIYKNAPQGDESGFSREFQDFINSRIKRDQLIGIWVEETVKEINQLCKNPNVICE